MMFVEVAFLITKTRLHNNSGYLNMPLRSVKLATMNESTALGSAKREFLEGNGFAASRF
jgi:hypothetical protein